MFQKGFYTIALNCFCMFIPHIFYGVPQQRSPSKLFAGDVELALPKKEEPYDASFPCLMCYMDSR